tara:strand:+ start:45 stop:1289 length:1245 start_codon:yes stop_codon:yes gene_type:complete
MPVGNLLKNLFGQDASKLNEIALEQQFHINNEMWAYNWAVTQDNYAFQLEGLAAQKLNEATLNAYKEQSEFNAWMNRNNLRLYEYGKEVEAYNASVASYEQQIDYNSAAEELAINDAERVYADQLIAFGFQNQDLIMKYYEAAEQKDFDIKKLQTKVDQAIGLAKRQKQEVTLNKKWDKAQAALDNAGLREGLAATKAEMAFKTEQARIENIQAVGQQQNLGQSGRSAQKAISSLLASYGQGQAAMADSLSRAESKYMLDKRRVAETLAHKEKLSNLSYRQISSNLANTIQDAKTAEEGIGMKFDQLKERTEFGQEQIQQSIKSAEQQHIADRNKIEMDKHQQDLQAASMVTTRPTLQPAESLPLQIPETQYVDPQKPTPPPKPVLGANTVPQAGILDKVGQVMNIVAPFMGGN